MQSLFLQIDVPEIVIHKADQPNTFFDLLDTDCLTSEDGADCKSLKSRMTISSGEPKNQPRNGSVGRLKVEMVKMLFATRYRWRPARSGEPARPPVPIACNTKERRTDRNTNECRVNQHGDRQRKSDHLDH